jgi:hypothetical protein
MTEMLSSIVGSSSLSPMYKADRQNAPGSSRPIADANRGCVTRKS